MIDIEVDLQSTKVKSNIATGLRAFCHLHTLHKKVKVI